MALAIGPLGTVSNLADDRAHGATRNEGCVYIRRRAQSVIVSVDFDRLTGPAIAATLYELWDMKPENICLAGDDNRITEIIIGFEASFRRICEVFVDADVREEYSGMPLLPDGTTDYFEVKH